MTPAASPPTERIFRRQFLLTPQPVGHLPGWRRLAFAGSHVHVHPDLRATAVAAPQASMLLLGFVLDPDEPGADDETILRGLGAAPVGTDAWYRRFDRLSGRFVLLIERDDRMLVFTDPSALRRIVYVRDERGFHAASDTALLRTAAAIEDGGRVRQWASSRHFRASEEHWLPGDVTLYPAVRRLLANHVLDTGTGEQTRFWPRGPITPVDDPAGAAERVGRVLAGSLQAAAERFPLSLPLTAGLDSRTLLVAAGPSAARFDLYTGLYRDLVRSSADASIAARVAAERRLPHRTIDCRRRPSASWREAYLSHATLAHFRDIGVIGYGLGEGVDEGRVVLNGTVAEAARFFFSRDGRPPAVRSAGDLLRLVHGWGEVPFVVEAIAGWYDGVRHAQDWGYDLSSLFYWEHRTGGWQAQSQLESDLVHESFSPFSNRAMLQLMLSVSEELRLGPDYAFLYEIPRRLDPAALAVPVNPITRGDRVRRFLWRARRKVLRPVTWRMRRRDLIGATS